MRTLKLILEYDGTEYVGWQLQAHGRSIQGELERALEILLKEPVRVTGAGRTDSGVHALGQVASFRTARDVPLKAFVAGLNSLLPRDIAVRSAAEERPGFDARRAASGKRYRYRIINRRTRAPLEQRYAWEVFPALDVVAMQEGARALVGRHDFSAFRAGDCQASTTVRELRSLEIRRDGDGLVMEVEATAFLKHMVRNIAGTLVEVGRGKRPARALGEVLDSKDRARAGPTAPAHGLCLVEVYYEDRD
jgi:tRNA pseudouridine38-40 synthase